MIKMEIRSKTIQYSKNRRLNLKRKEIELQEGNPKTRPANM